jgi:hypothetical protein|nr:MAG TPA: hypothetical protein [Caudoviricetes sp.]
MIMSWFSHDDVCVVGDINTDWEDVYDHALVAKEELPEIFYSFYHSAHYDGFYPWEQELLAIYNGINTFCFNSSLRNMKNRLGKLPNFLTWKEHRRCVEAIVYGKPQNLVRYLMNQCFSPDDVFLPPRYLAYKERDWRIVWIDRIDQDL